MGTLGRTQPGDRGCTDPAAATEDQQNLCQPGRLREARRGPRRARRSTNAQPLTGKPVVASQLLPDPGRLLERAAARPALRGRARRRADRPRRSRRRGSPATCWARSPPARASATCCCPRAPARCTRRSRSRSRDTVPARGHMTAGLANDQLGYLIAPYESYPEPIRRSFFNQRGDEVSPIDNDNYFFNVSHTIGERVTCSLLRGAGEVTGKGMTLLERLRPLRHVRERRGAAGRQRHRLLVRRVQQVPHLAHRHRQRRQVVVVAHPDVGQRLERALGARLACTQSRRARRGRRRARRAAPRR